MATEHPEDAHKRSPSHVEDIHHPGKVSHGDTALALLADGGELESAEPEELKKLVRKIDWVILPFLSVCYAFYYVSVQIPRMGSSDTDRLTKLHCHMQQSLESRRI